MKLLIVEDEQKIASALKRGLEAERYVVDIANDGHSGLKLISSQNYDALVLDLMLPGLSGNEILEKMQENAITTPTIVLTARESISDKLQSFNLGASDYLTKPFAFSELLARLHVITARGKQPNNGTTKMLKVDNLELDPTSKIVMRGGVPIELSAKEYNLLEYLMRHPGAVFSGAQIIDHVWSYDYDGFSNVVAVYIRYIRNKVDRAFPEDKQLISTIKGLGYKIG